MHPSSPMYVITMAILMTFTLAPGHIDLTTAITHFTLRTTLIQSPYNPSTVTNPQVNHSPTTLSNPSTPSLCSF